MMKSRCVDEKGSRYEYYGKRGIKICDEWFNSFESFRDWSMAHGWQPGLSLDRIDNDGDYTPENCRWVVFKEQCRNRRSNKNITIDGETHILTEWLEIRGIKRATYYSRLRMGWSVEDALSSTTRRKHK